MYTAYTNDIKINKSKFSLKKKLLINSNFQLN